VFSIILTLLLLLTYNWGLGAEPPEAVEVFVFKTVISGPSATVFARNDVLFELLLLIQCCTFSFLMLHNQPVIIHAKIGSGVQYYSNIVAIADRSLLIHCCDSLQSVRPSDSVDHRYQRCLLLVAFDAVHHNSCVKCSVAS